MGARFVAALNRQGKLRFARWYAEYSREGKRNAIKEVLKCVKNKREEGVDICAFGRNGEKLVFKKYNGLYFVVCIEAAGGEMEDDELRYLTSIPLIVKLLDVYFDNVSELDLIFNFYKIQRVVDQVYIHGELISHRQEEVMDALTLVL